MAAYIVRRLWQMAPTMLGVVLLVFILFNWSAAIRLISWPARCPLSNRSTMSGASSASTSLTRCSYGFHQADRHLRLWRELEHGRGGFPRDPDAPRPSLTVLIPLTILETVIAIALALGIAFVRGGLTDRLVMVACTVGMSISILVYIIVFQYWFAYKWGLFPVQAGAIIFSGTCFAIRPCLS